MYFLVSLILVISSWFLVKKRVCKQFGPGNEKMVNSISILIYTLVFALSVSLYLKYDREQSEYGLSCIFCNESMPFGISPKSGNYANGLALVDDADFELVDKGFKYQNTDFKINGFLAYAYNDTSILVKCTDSLNQIKYLVSYKTGYTSRKKNAEISFNELNLVDFEKIQEKYHWVVLDKKQLQSLTTKRVLSLVGICLFFFFLLITGLKMIRTKAD